MTRPNHRRYRRYVVRHMQTGNYLQLGRGKAWRWVSTEVEATRFNSEHEAVEISDRAGINGYTVIEVQTL